MLPQIDVKLAVIGSFPQHPKAKEAADSATSKNKSPRIHIDTADESRVYSLFEDEEYVIKMDMNRSSRSAKANRSHFNGKAYTPKYSKPKDENWIVILGENTSANKDASSQLVGLKRVVSLKKHQTTNIVFKTPRIDENSGRSDYTLTVYLMSDVYLGLDQQFELRFKLASATKPNSQS